VLLEFLADYDSDPNSQDLLEKHVSKWEILYYYYEEENSGMKSFCPRVQLQILTVVFLWRTTETFGAE